MTMLGASAREEIPRPALIASLDNVLFTLRLY